MSQGELSNSNAQSSQETLLVIFIIFCIKIQSTHQCLWFSTWSSRLSCVHTALSEVRPVNTTPSVLKAWHQHPTRCHHPARGVRAQHPGTPLGCLLLTGGLARAMAPMSSFQQEDWLEADQSTQNLSALNWKMDQNKQGLASLIVTHE